LWLFIITLTDEGFQNKSAQKGLILSS